MTIITSSAWLTTSSTLLVTTCCYLTRISCRSVLSSRFRSWSSELIPMTIRGVNNCVFSKKRKKSACGLNNNVLQWQRTTSNSLSHVRWSTASRRSPTHQQVKLLTRPSLKQPAKNLKRIKLLLEMVKLSVQAKLLKHPKQWRLDQRLQRILVLLQLQMDQKTPTRLLLPGPLGAQMVRKPSWPWIRTKFSPKDELFSLFYWNSLIVLFRHFSCFLSKIHKIWLSASFSSRLDFGWSLDAWNKADIALVLWRVYRSAVHAEKIWLFLAFQLYDALFRWALLPRRALHINVQDDNCNHNYNHENAHRDAHDNPLIDFLVTRRIREASCGSSCFTWSTGLAYRPSIVPTRVCPLRALVAYLDRRRDLNSSVALFAFTIIVNYSILCAKAVARKTRACRTPRLCWNAHLAPRTVACWSSDITCLHCWWSTIYVKIS